jgi:predicted ester cyclase
MAVLSVMAIEGDPDDLIARMEATIEPVAARKAPQYGGISSTVVRTDNGIKIFNLWETEEGRHKMADDPEVQASIRGAGFPAPAFKAHEVLRIRSAGETGKALARRIVDEVWTQGKLDVIDEVIAPDFVGYDPTNGEFRGRDGFRQLVEGYRSTFSNIAMRIESIVAEGDWIAARWTARGTHTAELMGVAPTGREVTVEGTQFNRIRDGMIVEGRGLFDALGMLQQLGAVPTAAPAHA